MRRGAVVMGGTGLVGSALLRLLSQDPRFHPVHALGRRPSGVAGVVDARVETPQPRDVPEVGTAFCCLGTTRRKAGSREAFRAVDHGLVLAFARACRERGVNGFHVVSAMSSGERSPFFYSRVKGEMERDVRALGFGTTCVYRPSLLLGERSEERPGERAGAAFARLARPLLPARWRALPAEVVARAMIEGAASSPPGFHVFDSARLWEMAETAGAPGR